MGFTDELGLGAMRIWQRRCSQNTHAHLTDEAVAVVGLWSMGFRDIRYVAERIRGLSCEREKRGFVRRVVESRNVVIQNCLAAPPVEMAAEIKGVVRCPGCGAKIFCVPCRFCSSIGVLSGYTEVQVVGAWASRPTRHLPGTAGKLSVLQSRAAAGEPLWHPEDSRLPWPLRNDRVRRVELVTRCHLTDEDVWCCPEDEVGPDVTELTGG